MTAAVPVRWMRGGAGDAAGWSDSASDGELYPPPSAIHLVCLPNSIGIRAASENLFEFNCCPSLPLNLAPSRRVWPNDAAMLGNPRSPQPRHHSTISLGQLNCHVAFQMRDSAICLAHTQSVAPRSGVSHAEVTLAVAVDGLPGRCPAHGDSDKPTHAVAVSRCPYSHICVGTSNIERVINYVEPCLLPSRMRVSPPARPGYAICVVPLQCDRSRNTGSPVMPACRHGANPQSICESECPQKRPTLSRLQRRANYPEHRDE